MADWQQARWEIYGYPPSWPTPTGWTLDSTTGIIYSTSFTPNLITLEPAATRWGKWLVRLTVDGGTKNGTPNHPDVIYDAVGWEVLSPNLGLHDVAPQERGQFDSIKWWAGALALSMRLLDTFAGGGLVGDVNGPFGSNKVYTLSGNANVVTLASGAKITSAIGTVGDIVAASAGLLSFGNSATVGTVQLQAATAVYLRGLGGNVQLSSQDIYVDSDVATHFRTVAGAEGFKVVASGPYIQLDSASGTFPAAGLLRTKSYAGAQMLWGGRNTGGDATIVQQNGINLNIGDSNNTSGWALNINMFNGTIQARTNLILYGQTSGGIQFADFASANINLKFDPAAAAGAFVAHFAANITPTIKQDDQTAASTNGVNTTYNAQNATGATSDGGSNQFACGTGTSVYGKAAIFQGAIDFGRGDVSFPNSAVTLTAAQSTVNFLRLTAGGIAGAQNLTLTRRAASPGQVLIFNNTGFTITVFWLTGTGIAITTGTTMWVGSDGTNAIKVG